MKQDCGFNLFRRNVFNTDGNILKMDRKQIKRMVQGKPRHGSTASHYLFKSVSLSSVRLNAPRLRR